MNILSLSTMSTSSMACPLERVQGPDLDTASGRTLWTSWAITPVIGIRISGTKSRHWFNILAAMYVVLNDVIHLAAVLQGAVVWTPFCTGTCRSSACWHSPAETSASPHTIRFWYVCRMVVGPGEMFIGIIYVLCLATQITYAHRRTGRGWKKHEIPCQKILSELLVIFVSGCLWL